MAWHSIKCKSTWNDCDLLYKESTFTVYEATWIDHGLDVETYTSGDHIGLLLNYDEDTWTFLKGGNRVTKGHGLLNQDLNNTDLYICVGSKEFPGSSIRLVTARKGMYILWRSIWHPHSLRSMAGLVIQATGRTEFEDGLRPGSPRGVLYDNPSICTSSLVTLAL